VNATARLDVYTSSAVEIRGAAVKMYKQMTDPRLFVRRVTVSAGNVVVEGYEEKCSEQFELFTDYDALEEKKRQDEARRDKEKRQMQAALEIKKRFGKNAIVRGMDMEQGATGMDRNNQIGGHKA
jgi:DNA polymerase V